MSLQESVKEEADNQKTPDSIQREEQVSLQKCDESEKIVVFNGKIYKIYINDMIHPIS